MKYIGAHVSIAGSLANAPRRASELGATAFAMFTKNQRQWSAPPITDEQAAEFRHAVQELGFEPRAILPHDTYLINLGQPDAAKRRAATEAFQQELVRCGKLGLDKLNFHPGSSLKLVSEAEDIRLIAESVRNAIDETDEVKAVFEITAGQGSNLGYTLEQLSAMLEAVGRPGRVGVCIDTCHAHAAGYDLVTPEGYARFWADFDRLIGFGLLAGMHLNDAICERGAKIDRHAPLGQGKLGWETFRRLMQDPHLDARPLVLETPDETRWAREIAVLQAMSRGETPELC